jgi:NDP-sugar pyrophosphorylase family protein
VKAVILAAGKGTRMGSLTRDIPKPMIPVLGKPIVEHVMRRMMAAGVTDFVLVTRYLSEKISDYFGDGSRFGARVEYVDQIDKYGTGAALLSAKELVGGEPVMLTFADVITSAGTYAQAIREFSEKGGVGVVTVNRVDDPCTGAAVLIGADGRIERIIEKPPRGKSPSNWNASGIFVFSPAIFDYLERLEPSWRDEYELADAQNLMIADGLPLYPSYLEGDWLDVGSVEALKLVESMLGQC